MVTTGQTGIGGAKLEVTINDSTINDSDPLIADQRSAINDSDPLNPLNTTGQAGYRSS